MAAYKDKRGYKREHSNAIHRKRAYTEIYLKNRKKYPKPFSHYEVHHKDFDKTNNRVSNLQIVTPPEHDEIHERKENLISEHLVKRKKRRIRFFLIYLLACYVGSFFFLFKVIEESFLRSLLQGLIGIPIGAVIFVLIASIFES